VLADARSLSAGESIEADVCVVGAGPAGLVIARELDSGGARVCVLESGTGDGIENPSDPLEAEVTGGEYPIERARARGFGGTATIWTSEVARNKLGARYGRLQAVDLEHRAEVPFSGWPFDRRHLDPYYERAARICEIEPLLEEPAEWEKPPRLVPLPPGNALTTRIVRYGLQSVFTVRYRAWAEKSERVRVYLHARAVGLETDPDGFGVRHVVAASEPGRTFRVTARLFVLALGGIENARLLLSSSAAQDASFGNGNDLVGRFFMDHPTATCLFIPSGPKAVDRLVFYDTLPRDRGIAQGSLGLSEETIRNEGLLNSGLILAPSIERKMRALQAAGTLRDAARNRRLPDDAVKASCDLALGLDAVATAVYRRLVEKLPGLESTTRIWPTTRLLNTLDIGHISGWSRLPLAHRRFRSFGLYHTIEQAPEPDRRVTLSSRKDNFGLPLARLHWFISEREVDSMCRTQQIIAAALGRAGLGRVIATDQLAPEGDVRRSIFPSAYHHLGTTRMHRDADRGVVDENCLVHGMTNLFVTGTSVFPTGGYINPTLTVVALAVRLAEHLKTSLRQAPEAGAAA
jgi:choline dehydrogenase-like flavoprotein